MPGIALGVADKTLHTRNVSHWGITHGGVAQPGIILNVAATLKPKLDIDVAALQIFGGRMHGALEFWKPEIRDGGVRCQVSAFQFSSFPGFYPVPNRQSHPTKIDAVHDSVDSSPCMSAEIWISGFLEDWNSTPFFPPCFCYVWPYISFSGRKPIKSKK